MRKHQKNNGILQIVEYKIAIKDDTTLSDTNLSSTPRSLLITINSKNSIQANNFQILLTQPSSSITFSSTILSDTNFPTSSNPPSRSKLITIHYTFKPLLHHFQFNTVQQLQSSTNWHHQYRQVSENNQM
jgi:hypothetical protein